MSSLTCHPLRRRLLRLALVLLLPGAMAGSAPMPAQGVTAQELLTRGQQLWNESTKDSLEASLEVYGRAQAAARARGMTSMSSSETTTFMPIFCMAARVFSICSKGTESSS